MEFDQGIKLHKSNLVCNCLGTDLFAFDARKSNDIFGGGTVDMMLVVQTIQFVAQVLMLSIPVYGVKLLVNKIRSMKNGVD